MSDTVNVLSENCVERLREAEKIVIQHSRYPIPDRTVDLRVTRKVTTAFQRSAIDVLLVFVPAKTLRFF
jgi:hypothetical protein